MATQQIDCEERSKEDEGWKWEKKNSIFHPAQEKAWKTWRETNTFSCRQSTFLGNLPPFEDQGAEKKNPAAPGMWISLSLPSWKWTVASHISVTGGAGPLGAQQPLEDVCATDRRRLQMISSVFNTLRGNILGGFLKYIYIYIYLWTLPRVLCESIRPSDGSADVSVGTEHPEGAQYQAHAINI